MHWTERTPLLNRNVYIANFELREVSPCPCSKMSKLELNYTLRISSIAARREAHWTKVYAGDLFSVRWYDVLLYKISSKWRSGKWCFGKTTFGWTTIRKNDVRLNNDSEKCHSALWSFANSTIRSCDDSVIRRFGQMTFGNFFFGKTTIWQDCISARRLAEMQFWRRRIDRRTFRENDVAPLKNRRALMDTQCISRINTFFETSTIGLFFFKCHLECIQVKF